MQLRALFKKAIRIYRDEGLVALIRSIGKYIRYSPVTYQGGKRNDINQRFNLIISSLDKNYDNLLDIGCAEGVLTQKFNKKNIYSVGLDTSVTRISKARKNRESPAGPNFLHFEISPSNVRKFPNFDIILLLTVYHFWVDMYGFEQSEEMLCALANTTEVLFFETPAGKLDHPEFKDNSDLDVYYQNYLECVLPDEAIVNMIGIATYSGGSREDPIFKIDCSGV